MKPAKKSNSALYCEQLTCLKTLQKQRAELICIKGIKFHHDNTKPHKFLKARQKLKGVGCKILINPPN